MSVTILRWYPETTNVIEAIGRRGTYTIRLLPGGSRILKIVGHDGLPPVHMPCEGLALDTLAKAKMRADAYEGSSHAEPHASGA